MLFYRHRLDENSMKFLVVTENNPFILAAYFKPNIICHCLTKIIFFTVMILHREWRLRVFKCLRETRAEISIKIER